MSSYRVCCIPQRRELQQLQQRLNGALDHRYKGSNTVGHSEAYLLMAPGTHTWRCLEYYRDASPDWVVEHQHVVGLFTRVSSPDCAYRNNPFTIVTIDGCPSCVTTYALHSEEILGREFFKSSTTP